MRYFLFTLFVVPQMLFAQYTDKHFRMDKSKETAALPIRMAVENDVSKALAIDGIIYGSSVSGYASLNEEDSYVRIILRNKYGYDYLVYENYPLLSATKTPTFDNVGIETVSLDGIMPDQLIVKVHKATIKIDSVYYTREKNISERKNIEQAQAQSIINCLNKNLEERNMTWRAGLTPVALLSYEEKKSLFGGEMPELYGFEYYTGGIFVMPNSEHTEALPVEASSSAFVDSWDWRDRHGRNWMTSVKSQGACGSCWAFSAIGALEAYVNLYYNRSLNLNLSEQQLVSCASSNGCAGGSRGTALNYIKNNGVVNEDCFLYTHTNGDCNDKCNSPEEEIFLGDYGWLSNNEAAIKQKLFIAPVTFGISSWSHALVLAGYKTIQEGDRIYLRSSTETGWVTISSTNHSNLIGKTVWLLKNSWGDTWGDNGYAYIYADLENINTPYYLSGNITSMSYTDSDVVCSDADGDGYYFWGVGPKPSFCPSWVPDVPDGNDANHNQGGLTNMAFWRS